MSKRVYYKRDTPSTVRGLCMKCGIRKQKSSGGGRYKALCYSCGYDKKKISDWKYKQNYGISLEDFENLNKEQEDKCAICGKLSKDSTKGKLFVDHGHTTGAVRGLLCNHCNILIGFAKDDLSILDKAKSYLDKFK